ncbi:hypothetical protein [Pseudoalteromonas phage PH357]|nr:hypothetical protein [Pseudoalteromonas phage PH357]
MNRLFAKGLLLLAEQHKENPNYTNPYTIIECIEKLESLELLSEEESDLLHDWAKDCWEM